MDILSRINPEELFYSCLTVFITVFFLVIVKVFGNIGVSVLSIGTDLNLLTYGFLWDTSVKALRGQDFWTRFWMDKTFLTRPVILLIIFIGNFLIMALNLKLESIIRLRTNQGGQSVWITQWFLKPGVVALGVFSLMIFLILNSAWS